MLSTIQSLGILGIDPYPVTVEVNVARAMPAFDIVGLPDAAVRESRERVRSVLSNCGYPFPDGRIVVNLAPADVKKAGSLYDLPILVGLLAAQGLLPENAPLVDSAFIGEVSLSGEAYFEVARHAALPFRVEARGCTFTVLGTKFDISAYAEDPAVTAALLEGALRFESEDKHEAMTPGDLVTYDCATATVRREQVDVRQYRAWIDGVIRYDAITLPSLLRRLAREYDVEIDLRTRRFDDTTFRISLSSAQNIKSVMRALCDILPISVSCEGCRYVVDALPQ